MAESEAFEGVKRISKVVSEDICLATAKTPAIVSALDDVDTDSVILAATVGKSPLLDKLAASGLVDISAILNKREVYLIQHLEAPFAEHPEIKDVLVVAGIDKRATIYGLFDISAACGISPLVYWGDIAPKQKDEVCVDYSVPYISKQPSVKYRGFFINDEWPAFGGWCRDRFGGFNVNAYEHVFQLLLRLKGNYFWPAMWSSTFSEDGPGIANAELANIYGVVMGASHHEPMCRAGAEWQHIYKNYGDDNTWSFISNSEAITEFWRDGLKRNKDFENVITVGMRGENDSLLLGANATLEDNINVLKGVINKQNELMTEIVNPKLEEIPRMLALYNEVEDFYYAPEKGLKGWEALDGVILMLCDDNFANLRYLPTDDDRDHNGGFGMYYHYDYHGASISYEWINSNRLTKTWEQMSMAYDYGIRDMWIVNLGDIKGLEYPLCYFLTLAYDFEKYGSDNPNKVEEYVYDWIKTQYGEWLTDNQQRDVFTVLNGYTKYNNARTPESMNSTIYSPVNFREGERVWTECQDLIDLATKLYNEAPDGCKDSIFTMVYYPCVASLNLVQMSIEAGWNNFYAAKGSLAANKYLDCVKKRVARDYELKNQFDSILDGKWIHMMDSAHHGFRTWNDDDWRYPTVSEVTPVFGGKSMVSFAGNERYSLGKFWSMSGPLFNREFMRPDTDYITINIETGSAADLEYKIDCNKPWLIFEKTEGVVTPADGMASINVKCDRTALTGEETAEISVICRFGSEGRTRARLFVAACPGNYNAEPMTFIDTEGYVSMDAHHFSANKSASDSEWVAIDHLSRIDTPALKVLPSTSAFLNKEDDSYNTTDVPYLEYSFVTNNAGDWEAAIYLSARNPVAIDAKLRLGISTNDGEVNVVSTIPAHYKARNCREWNDDVLACVRTCKTSITTVNGINKLKIFGGDPNIIIEKIVVYPKGKAPAKTYLGTPESYFVK
ncbi:MAG: glycosyl hydrolase 115 family protein [Oscillospiraceae bacterium]|nr:glycosyl hydrolase 115 family protein [Oscillospiraceae bacterium]